MRAVICDALSVIFCLFQHLPFICGILFPCCNFHGFPSHILRNAVLRDTLTTRSADRQSRKRDVRKTRPYFPPSVKTLRCLTTDGVQSRQVFLSVHPGGRLFDPPEACSFFIRANPHFYLWQCIAAPTVAALIGFIWLRS